MPSVSLGAYQAEEGLLPPVCMKCGERTEDVQPKKFSWVPEWTVVLILAGLLPYFIVSLALTKKMTILAPMCDAHRGHWRWRGLFTFLGLVFVVMIFVGGVVYGQSLRPRLRGEVMAVVFFATIVALAIFLIIAAVIRQSAIRPREITDDGITLGNVHADFVDAVRRTRRKREERRRRKSEHDDEWDLEEY